MIHQSDISTHMFHHRLDRTEVNYFIDGKVICKMIKSDF